MTILVLSDSHDSIYWENFINRFNFGKYDLVLHLGDNYSDIYDLQKIFTGDIIAVPGLWRKEYSDKAIENIRLIEFENFNIIMSHVENEGRLLFTDDKQYIQLFGHSHQYLIDKKDDNYLLNPGHLKNRIDRGYPATFGEIIVNGSSIDLIVKKAENSNIIIQKKLIISKGVCDE